MDVRGDARRLLFWWGIGLSFPTIIKLETYGPSMMSIIYLSSGSFRLNIDREMESFIKLFSKHLLYLAGPMEEENEIRNSRDLPVQRKLKTVQYIY